MAGKRPKTASQYIKAAPPAGQPHLRKLHAILKKAAPKAKAVIKWGNPFFVDPRFVYAYSAHKAHMSLAPTAEALVAFRRELEEYDTSKYFLRLPYDKPVPEALLRKIAKYRVRNMGDRDTFW
ncbi:MAG TPA: DUF1801 domain-containing protein [Vicinamibacteria bacterium]|nr:DUF1801 domain-containing protein [Vicinamibacteria bacterium]